MQINASIVADVTVTPDSPGDLQALFDYLLTKATPTTTIIKDDQLGTVRIQGTEFGVIAFADE